MPGCGRVFKTARGRGVHEQKAHKNWHDERQIECLHVQKAPWTAEESALLARQEARLVTGGERYLNKALTRFFPNRTLESIKGQRRYQKHKDLVLQYLDAANSSSPTTQSGNPDEHQSGLTTIDYRATILERFATFDHLTGTDFQVDQLNRICDHVSSWTTHQVHENLESYLLEIFPLPQREKPKSKKVNKDQPLSRRQMRRFEYAQTQRAWKKNPCKCLRRILKDKTSNLTPGQNTMEPFWRQVMTGGGAESPGASSGEQAPCALWDPIDPSEIEESFPERATAPGPDGLSARQLRAIPIPVLTRIFNLFLLCGRLPRHLMESRTILIPKKDEATNPGDYRPITMSSVITRTYHKILAKRLVRNIRLDPRQKAFVPVDGCAQNIFDLDTIVRYHRQFFKSLYIASLDVAKAFDSVSHNAIRDTLMTKGLPTPMVQYIMGIYQNSSTRLVCEDWESEPIHPNCGVKQGDPLSPIIFNMVIDELLKKLPPEVGVEINERHYSALAFADDLVFVASTSHGLQMVLDQTSRYLAQCGLKVNAAKSFTATIRNVPHVKKTVVDGGQIFECMGRALPALKRTDEWKYLGVPFTPEGRSCGREIIQLQTELAKLTKAPLKPQQRMFALRVMVLPGIYHLLTLGSTTLSRLRKIDAMVRGAVRKWLALPHDVTNSYIHANVKDGGLSVPSMRWLMPLRRMQRLQKYAKGERQICPYLAQEIDRAKRRLQEGRTLIDSVSKLDLRWAKLLHSSHDGMALKESRKVPQQHQWVTDGNRFLSGRDFINMMKLRINAMPTRSRTTRGRPSDRYCRAGCNEVETINHILQRCHRTHGPRIDRHNSVASYVKRALEKNHDRVEEEPHLQTTEGLRKPDLVATLGMSALVIDAQVVSEQADLDLAHRKKSDYYRGTITEAIKTKYSVESVEYLTATLTSRGVWSKSSADDLVSKGILLKKDLKIVSTRVLAGGLNSYWRFNRSTTSKRRREPG